MDYPAREYRTEFEDLAVRECLKYTGRDITLANKFKYDNELTPVGGNQGGPHVSNGSGGAYNFPHLYHPRYYHNQVEQSLQSYTTPVIKRYTQSHSPGTTVPHPSLHFNLNSVLNQTPAVNHNLSHTEYRQDPSVCANTRDKVSSTSATYCSDDSFDDGHVDDDLSEDELPCGANREDDQSGWTLITDPSLDINTESHCGERILFPFISKFPSNKNINPSITRESLDQLTAFQLFISDHLVEQLVQWTNQRARMFFADHSELKGKLLGQLWHDVNLNDMWTFLFLTLQMSICRLPSVLDYWRESPTRSGPAIFCSKVMGRNRYHQILRFLRFSCPSQFSRKCPLSRISQFSEQLRKACTSIIDPGREVAVDRSVLPFQHRLGKRHSVPSKWSRVRLSVCCPTSKYLRGYTWNFSIHISPGDLQASTKMLPSGAEGFSPSEKTLLFLIKEILHEGRLVVSDKDYTSVRLSDLLYDARTYLLGTLKRMRGVPLILDLPLKKQEIAFTRKGHKIIARHEELKESLYLLSTQHYATDFVYKTRHTTTGHKRPYKHPKMIREANLFMSSLDQIDHILHSYELVRKSYAWFKKLGMHLIARMALNAKVVYEIAGQLRHPLKYTEFIDSLVILGLSKYNKGAADIIHNYPTRKKAAEEKKAALAQGLKPLNKRKRKISLEPLPAPDLPPHITNTTSSYNEEENTPTNISKAKKKRRYIKRVPSTEVKQYQHFLQVIPSTLREKYPRKWCKVCSKTAANKASTRCRYACYGCIKPVGLCSNKCFEEYHLTSNR